MMKIKLQPPPSGVLKPRYGTLLPMHSHAEHGNESGQTI